MRTKLLSSIARLVTRHPWRVIAVASVLTLASALLATFVLQMNTDTDDLVSEKLGYHRNYKNYLREFGDLEYLFVAVEAKRNLPRAKEFVAKLSDRLQKLPGIKEVTYQISNPKLEKSFLLYLPDGQIKTIGEYLPKMERINGLADVFAMMNQTLTREDISKAATDETSKAGLETGFRFLDSLLDGMIDASKDAEPYTPFMQHAFFGGDRAYDEDGFLLSENGNMLFIMIMPEKNYKTLAVIDEPLKKIRSALHETRDEFPDVHAGLTGKPVLSADEMSISDADMTYATIAALIIVTLIFIVYFRKPTRPAMAAVALIMGIAQTFGLTTIVIGHLNILSIVFAVILVGAGFEFGLQIVSRYREELATHKNVRLAIETSIAQTGKGNMTAAATTAAAFFAACFTNFLALQELGFVAGMGIILCLANMFTVLPAMLYLHDRNKHPDRLETTLRINLKRFDWFYTHSKTVVTLTVLVSLVGALGLLKLGFNHNLLDLQARGLESVEYEKKIIAESTQSTWYAPIIASSKAGSLALAKKVKALPSIGKVETISDVVPENQPEKIKLISSLKKIPAGPARSSAAIDIRKLTNELKVFQKNVSHLAELAFSSGETKAIEALEGVSKKIDEILQLLVGHEARIQNYETAFVADLKRHIGLLRSGFNPEPVALSDMPEAIQRRYISKKTGRYQLYAYPREDIWDPQKMADFINDLRSVDPHVTGTPVEVYESSRLLERSFKQAAIFSLLAIILIVFMDFRKFKLSVLAITPLALGVLWLFELMGFFGIKFNLANFFGIPILLGVGVDNAVQVVHRYVKEKHVSGATAFMTRSTGVAVLLTSITTFASFGTLIFARHQGIASLGLIMTLGTVTCFIGSMIVLPCLLKIFRP